MAKWRSLVILFILSAGVGLVIILIYAIPRLGALTGPERMECTLIESNVLPKADSLFPPVSERDWQQGPEDALVTLIEYADFQCPDCAEIAPVLEQLSYEYPQDFRLVFRHFPLVSHANARLAAQAAEAAGLQGRFWDMHDLLYARQLEWKELSTSEFRDWLILQAQGLNLGVDKFEVDLTSPALHTAIDRASQPAVEVGLSTLPGLVLNGQYYEGIKDHWTLAALIELVRLEARQFHACPPLLIDTNREYSATLHTTQGDISLVLYAHAAPLAVNSFVFLAREGWYDGVPIFRVIPEFALQTGDPSGTGFGGPGYTLKTEIAPGAQFDRPGLVGLANEGTTGNSSVSNGSQFFITYAAQETLNGKYTLFGEVVSGMEVAAALTVRDPASNPENLPEADQIISVTLAEK